MPIIKKCLTCEKEFRTYWFRIKKGFGKYCCRKCIKFPSGKNSKCWKGKNVGYFALHRWVTKKLGRSKRCEDCGTTDIDKTYHWANISGKYFRDTKDFKRLCVKCHRAFDKTSASGELNGGSKLSQKDVTKIRKMYIPYKYGCAKLAKIFKVHHVTIQRIINKKSWKIYP